MSWYLWTDTYTPIIVLELFLILLPLSRNCCLIRFAFVFSTAERRELPEEAPSYVVLAFTLVMRRKMVFSTYILTLPCVFLATLTLLVFWLPPDRPDRTSLGTCSKDIKEYKECRYNSHARGTHLFFQEVCLANTQMPTM